MNKRPLISLPLFFLAFVLSVLLIALVVLASVSPLSSDTSVPSSSSAGNALPDYSQEASQASPAPQVDADKSTHSSLSKAAVNWTNDPYLEKQWALARVPVLPQNRKSADTIIAVLDTGIDSKHEDLDSKIIDNAIFSESISYADLNGHGTHIAGIIAASADNGIGISGAAPGVRLLNVKVSEDSGLVMVSSIARGILWAVDHGASVINMSLTTPSGSLALKEAVNYAWSRGVVLVAAAGNHTSALTFPAAIREVIAVAALNPDGTVWSESNNAAFVDAYAPGVEIFSTLPKNKYGYYSGSSMAAAYVSAAAALAFNTVQDENADGLLNTEVVNLVKSLYTIP